MSNAPVRVLVADQISPTGVELLEKTPGFEVVVKTGMEPAEFAKTVRDFDALIVRSATKVTPDVLRDCGKLRAIGRAGTGVDNIDLPAATAAGVVVMNTPGGNSVAAAELTLALLLSLSRNVAQANRDLRDNRWERKKYMGTEVAGKTLGVVGLGRIGREVARMAQGFRMDVIGYDPFVTAEMAADHGIAYRTLDELIAEADYISLHIPRTDETHHLIDAKRIATMKKGVRIINCARGGLIDEKALLEAIESGQVAGAGIDVFEQEPPKDLGLVEHPHVVSTPHLGASTREAQVRVGVEIAEKIRDYLQSGIILDAVNFPSINRKEFATLGPIMNLAERLGSLLGQIVDDGIKKLDVRTYGSFSDATLKPVVMAAVKGLVSSHVEGGVSYVNALDLAKQRGLAVDEGRSSDPSPYAGMIRLTVESSSGSSTVAGTLYRGDEPRLVEVNGAPLESRLNGHMLLVRNHDVPGVLGKIGQVLGKAKINIAGLQLGRIDDTDRAISIIGVDSAIPADILDSIRGLDEVATVRKAFV